MAAAILFTDQLQVQLI